MNTTILFIDDDQSSPVPLANLLRTSGSTVAIRSPEEVLLEDILRSHLVLVDYDLKIQPAEKLSHGIPDGVALASVLRRHIAYAPGDGRPVAFALWSGKLDRLSYPLPPTGRPQMSRQHNLEWVFGKDDVALSRSINSLAGAVARVPKAWADGIDGLAELAEPLALDANASDVDTCLERLERCCPPLTDFSLWTHGLAFVRWMLHNILPYPCFLADMRRVALRWRVPYEPFAEAFRTNSALAEYFKPAKYNGILCDFDEPRWWSHRIDRLAWEATDGDSLNPEALQKALRIHGAELPAVSMSDPVICYDDSLKALAEFHDSAKCCRIRPDGWPAYAEPAWLELTTLAQHPKLRSIVHPDDADRIPH
jgi:hypothetical protein